MAYRQYIGSRYVPIFGRKGEDTYEWDNSAPYEPLTVVMHQGNSFTSVQYVPTGIDINNRRYWAETGNWNAQIEAYRQEVGAYNRRITALEESLPVNDFNSTNTVDKRFDDIEALLPATEFDSTNTVDKRFDDIEALLPATAFDSTNTIEARFNTIEANGWVTTNRVEDAAITNAKMSQTANDIMAATNNPIYYGADPTGTTDSSSAIQDCIDANHGSTIVFTPGKYLVETKLVTPHIGDDRVSIDFNGAILFTNLGNTILHIGGDDPQTSGRAGLLRTFYVNGIFINNNNTQNPAIIIEPYYKDAAIEKCNIRFFYIGIDGGSNAAPLDLIVEDCLIFNNDVTSNTIGIKLNGSDSKITNNRIYGYNIPIDIKSGTNTITLNHIMPYGESSQTDIANLAAIVIENTSLQQICNNYVDTYPSMIKTINTVNTHLIVTCNNFYSYYHDMKCEIFDLSSCNGIDLKAKDNCIQFTSNVNNVGVKLNPTHSLTSSLEKINVAGNMLIGIISQGDLLLSENDKCFYWPSQRVAQNTWCAIALVPIYRQNCLVGINVAVPYQTVKTDILRILVNGSNGEASYAKCTNTSNLVYGYKVVTTSNSNTPYLIVLCKNTADTLAASEVMAEISSGNCSKIYTPGTSLGFVDPVTYADGEVTGTFTNN